MCFLAFLLFLVSTLAEDSSEVSSVEVIPSFDQRMKSLENDTFAGKRSAVADFFAVMAQRHDEMNDFWHHPDKVDTISQIGELIFKMKDWDLENVLERQYEKFGESFIYDACSYFITQNVYSVWQSDIDFVNEKIEKLCKNIEYRLTRKDNEVLKSRIKQIEKDKFVDLRLTLLRIERDLKRYSILISKIKRLVKSLTKETTLFIGGDLPSENQSENDIKHIKNLSKATVVLNKMLNGRITESIPKSLFNLPKFTDLKICHTGPIKIDSESPFKFGAADLLKLEKIESLELCNIPMPCNISKLANLRKLRIVNGCNVDFKEIEKIICLEDLAVINSDLEHMPLIKHTKLSKLDLSSNKIGEINIGVFVNVPNLASFVMKDGKKDVSFTDAFCSSQKMMKFDLEYTTVDDFEKSVSLLRKKFSNLLYFCAYNKEVGENAIIVTGRVKSRF